MSEDNTITQLLALAFFAWGIRQSRAIARDHIVTQSGVMWRVYLIRPTDIFVPRLP